MTDPVTVASRIAGAPAALSYRGAPERAAGHGTVLLYHGFGGSRERVGYYAAALARAGFLAVSVDAVGHGERRLADFDVIFSDERWDREFEATETDFLRLIDETAAEVPSVIDDLAAGGLAVPGRIGIGGRSLGGNVCYAAVLADPRIVAAAPVVARPSGLCPARTARTIMPIGSSRPLSSPRPPSWTSTARPARSVRSTHASRRTTGVSPTGSGTWSIATSAISLRRSSTTRPAGAWWPGSSGGWQITPPRQRSDLESRRYYAGRSGGRKAFLPRRAER